MKKSISEYLAGLHDRLKDLRQGDVADYIPELTRVDPDWFGIALVTVEGHVHQVGDSLRPFSIQSVSKPFTYGIALEDNGFQAVARKIDLEPSGEAFNSISLEPETGRPRNPMINAGAIVSAGLVAGNNSAAKIARILETFSLYAAHPLEVDEKIYLSEKTTGHRNRAISHLLRNYEIIENDPEEPLDAYFKQCSILVTAQDLALMGATLANKGVNPVTNVRALGADHVPTVLAAMASCGMYDYSGNWINSVGLPAKSGVGGGIVAVLPGQFGLAVFSPRLDAKGNSIRGIRVCETLSQDYALHILDSARMTTSNTVRALYTIRDASSRVERSEKETQALAETGTQIMICELTGEQSFVTSEALSTNLLREMEDRRYLVLDFERITGIDLASSKVFQELIRQLGQMGKKVIISGIQDKFSFRKRLIGALPATGQTGVIEIPELDQSMQFCEEQLLQEQFGELSADQSVSLANQPLCAGLDDGELAWLETLIERQSFQPGDLICDAGSVADGVYLIEKGKVDVLLKGDRGKPYKVASYCGGAVFGEAAFFPQSTRSANVVAISQVDVYLLRPSSLEASKQDLTTGVRMKLYKNLANLGFARLRAVNKILLTLTG